MTFLPIVAREMRVGSRRRGTYWIRAGAALWAIAIGTWFFLVMRRENAQDLSMGLFAVLTGSAALFCLFSGLRSTADCLSQEKREGTLGLLFLTDLKGYDVVFGKLAATSLGTLYGVLAVLPTLAIPLLLGGVTPAEFGRMALVVLNTMFFSLGAGMLASSVTRSARQASALTLLLILTFVVLLPVCGYWLEAAGKSSHRLHLLFFLPSPAATYSWAFDYTFRSSTGAFWWSALTVHGLGWLFLGLACLIVPRSWQEKNQHSAKGDWRKRWLRWSYGDSAQRLAFRRRLLDQNAFLWLAARARFKPAIVWAALCGIGALWAWGLAKYHDDWTSRGVYLTTGVALNLLLKVWVGVEAGRQIAEDRQHGALEWLLSTPLSVKEIIRGQKLALRRQFLWPVLLVMILFLGFMFAGLKEIYSQRNLWVSLWIAAIVMLAADLWALSWVGLWQGAVARDPQRAGSGSLARILVLPWVGMAMVMLGVSLFMIDNQFEPSEYFFLIVWIALGIVTDAAFAAYSRWKMLNQFREAASEASWRKKSFWQRLLPVRGRRSEA